MARVVREPIQVYLTQQERGALDRVARELGVSRSEALRRGLLGLSETEYGGELRELARDGLVTPPTAGPGPPPPSAPVASLQELLSELDDDRGER